MIFYLARDQHGNRQLASTQAEAKAIDRNFEQLDIPTDKPNLRTFVQDLLTQIDNRPVDLGTQRAEASPPPPPPPSAPKTWASAREAAREKRTMLYEAIVEADENEINSIILFAIQCGIEHAARHQKKAADFVASLRNQP